MTDYSDELSFRFLLEKYMTMMIAHDYVHRVLFFMLLSITRRHAVRKAKFLNHRKQMKEKHLSETCLTVNERTKC